MESRLAACILHLKKNGSRESYGRVKNVCPESFQIRIYVDIMDAFKSPHAVFECKKTLTELKNIVEDFKADMREEGIQKILQHGDHTFVPMHA